MKRLFRKNVSLNNMLLLFFIPAAMAFNNKEFYSSGLFLGKFIRWAVNNGVPQSTLLFLLLLPLIALIVAFFKQVIGIKTLGIYLPSILTIVFLNTRLLGGLILFLTIFTLGTLFRYLLKRVRILYIPKVAILLTFLSFSIIFLLSLAARYKITDIGLVSVLAIFVMIVLMEEFVDVQLRRSLKESIYLFLGTLLVSILSYFVAAPQALQNFFLKYPEIVLIILVFDYVLGKWSGLRLTEYYRFRKVIKHISESQK